MLLGLAPMDWFSDCAFRQIVKEIFDKYGEKEKYELVLWTEFMNADGYIINPPWVMKHLLTDTYQSPVIAQIFWGNEDMLTKCFVDIEKKYFCNLECKIQNAEKNKKKSDNSEFPSFEDKWILNSTFSWIELNMGCPARNVMNTWWGSALLQNKKNTLDIIKKLSWTINMLFSIKTRTGINEEDRKNQMEFLREASKYVSMISIHGRTVKQAYTGDADWEFIYELKKQIQGKRDKEQGTSSKSHVPECKVIGNGWIKSYEDINNRAKWIHTSYSNFAFHESSDYLKERWLISDWKYLPYDPLLKERARELRKNMTPAEKKIWKQCLKFLDVNILRQKVIDHYIADFYIPSRSLIIEIDWDTHFNDEAKWYDKVRTQILESYWLEVLRITNDDIYNNFDWVCEIIENKITPNPSLPKRGAIIASSFAKGGARRAEDFLVDGIMIGQAAIGNPRIFTPHTPSREEIKTTIIKHLDYMISYEEYFQEQKENFTGILTMPSSDIICHHPKKSSVIIISEFRKHLFQYVKWIPWSKEFKQKVAMIVDYRQLVKEIQEFFV